MPPSYEESTSQCNSTHQENNNHPTDLTSFDNQNDETLNILPIGYPSNPPPYSEVEGDLDNFQVC